MRKDGDFHAKANNKDQQKQTVPLAASRPLWLRYTGVIRIDTLLEKWEQALPAVHEEGTSLLFRVSRAPFLPTLQS